MRVDLFDFELPPERIALQPASPRDAARMLVVAPDGALDDAHVFDLPRLLAPGDALVVNDTRVIAARLDGVRVRGAAVAAIEATLIKRLDASRWRALVSPAKKLRVGERIRFGEARESTACLLGALDAEVEAKGRGRRGDARLRVSRRRARRGDRAASASRRCRPISPRGAPPAPARPRGLPDDVRATKQGAVAAPTAGLHFTPELLRARRSGRRAAASRDPACRRRHLPAGQGRRHRRPRRCTRNGAGSTRRPPRRSTRRAGGGGRIVAVGTTRLRLLESAADEDGAHRAFRRRDRDLHHARLSLPRGRRAADQFPSAALDAVHAGLRPSAASRR